MSFEPDSKLHDSIDNALSQSVLIELKKLVSMFSEVHDLEITDEDIEDGDN